LIVDKRICHFYRFPCIISHNDN